MEVVVAAPFGAATTTLFISPKSQQKIKDIHQVVKKPQK